MHDGNIHCSVKNVSRIRSNGRQRTAVAAAAYVSGSRLWNKFEGRYTNFSRKKDVTFSEILVPDGATDWCQDREALWNNVDMQARRKDARLAKSVVVAITRGIPRDKWPDMVRQYAAQWVAQGMVADIAIHDDNRENQANYNPHAHVMLTVNQLKPDGFGKKITNVDQKSFVTEARRGWEQITNEALKAIGSSVRVDSRSYKARGLELQPTKHRGPDRAERRARRAQSRELKEERNMNGREEERQHKAEEAAEQQLHDNNVGGWFEQKVKTTRQPWYEEARSNAQTQQNTRHGEAATEQTMEAEVRERQTTYEQDLRKRAQNMTRTREEHDLLEMAKNATPALRRRIEAEVIEQRMANLRQHDDTKRIAELEAEMTPNLRDSFSSYMENFRGQIRDPEPGPYGDPTHPDELKRAQDRLIKENEREQDR